MSVKIRLQRGGSKKKPFYRIVAADTRAPRDGKFIEKLGTYNPLVAKDSPERIVLKQENIENWLAKGAIPSERVAIILESLGYGKDSKTLKDVLARREVSKAARKEIIEAKKKAEAEKKAAEEAAKKAEEEAAAKEAAEAEAPTEEEKKEGEEAA